MSVTVHVTETLGDLERDLSSMPERHLTTMARIVKRNVEGGNDTARRIARAASGPHGTNYYKRITGEMTGALEGEFGPHGDVVGNAVGGGWRNGPINTDLDKAADFVRARLARETDAHLKTLFW